MEIVHLNADFSASQDAWLCPDCHGVWMRANECLAVLGLDCSRLIPKSCKAPIALECPHCRSAFLATSVDFDGHDPIRFHICPRCEACFFDSCGFAMVFYQQLRIERAASGTLAHSPLDQMGVKCCNCGAAISGPDEMFDAGIGYCLSLIHIS